MTARDLATLALRTIADFPEYYHYYGEKDIPSTISIRETAIR